MSISNSSYRIFSPAPSAAPRNVQGHNTSSTSIQVSWEAPSAADQNGALTEYTVYYQAIGGNFNDGTPKQKAVVAPWSQVFLTGLEEYVEYNISVSASTSVGEGPFSVSIIVRTAEAGKTLSVEKTSVFFDRFFRGRMKRFDFTVDLQCRSGCVSKSKWPLDFFNVFHHLWFEDSLVM